MIFSLLARVFRRALSLWVALFVTFVFVRTVVLKLPGTVADFLSDSESNVADLLQIKNEIIAEQSFWEQFQGFLFLNWGESALYGKESLLLIFDHFKITLLFALFSLFLSFVFSLMFFLLPKKPAQLIVRGLLSVPPLALFPAVVFTLCIFTKFCPAGSSNIFMSLLVASFAQALLSFPRLYRELDWELDQIRRKRFVLVLRAKGLSRFDIWVKHVFLNAFAPVLSLLILTFLSLISGSVLVEAVLDLPGLGVLLLEAIRARDFLLLFPLVMFLSLLHLFVLRTTKYFKRWRLIFGDS